MISPVPAPARSSSRRGPQHTGRAGPPAHPPPSRSAPKPVTGAGPTTPISKARPPDRGLRSAIAIPRSPISCPRMLLQPIPEPPLDPAPDPTAPRENQPRRVSVPAGADSSRERSLLRHPRRLAARWVAAPRQRQARPRFVTSRPSPARPRASAAPAARADAPARASGPGSRQSPAASGAVRPPGQTASESPPARARRAGPSAA